MKGNGIDAWTLRTIVVVGCIAILAAFRPPELNATAGAALGAALGLAVLGAEWRLRKLSLGRLIGGAAGAVVGLAAAFLIASVLGDSITTGVAGALQLGALIACAYLGWTLGALKGEQLDLTALGFVGAQSETARVRKILDTSVIIDGRIADIAEAGFLDGQLIVPQFVLWELQLVADSGDAQKRNRGRRGLDVLQRLQKMTAVDVNIIENDFPQLKEVDQKLIELAREIDAKVVTNDFNLNKLAQLQGVKVLNINELANSLKPVVLPGEIMQVFILKEGKEYNQGVAYLDDGTMVVVDNARDQISKTIDISVTSVLQTTAGKMIFGRFEGIAEGRQEQPSAPTSASPGRPRRSSGATRTYAAQRDAAD